MFSGGTKPGGTPPGCCQTFFRNFCRLLPFHPVNRVMKTETIVLNVAALRGGNGSAQLPAARFDGTSMVTNLVVEATHARRVRGSQPVTAPAADIGSETAVILHHEAAARIEEATLHDHATVGE